MTGVRIPYSTTNLESLLLATAEGLIADGGLSALSLRELGREAGVSRTAPYHYFADKAALVSKVGASSFARLADQIDAALVTAGDLETRCLAGLRAYVGFALDEPHLFRLMFSDVLIRHTLMHDATMATAVAFRNDSAMRAFRGFAEAISAAQAAHELAAEDPMLIVQMLWAYAHGVAELALGDNITLVGRVDELLESGLKALLDRYRPAD